MTRYALITLLVVAAPAVAQTPQAATRPADTGEVTVVRVTPPAQKLIPGSEWTVLQAGDTLGEQTVLRTGLGAEVVLNFSDRGEVTVSGPCKMGIREFRTADRSSTARVGLKYGTVRAQVRPGSGENDWRVATPVATLSVRGSESLFGLAFDNPQPLKVKVERGAWRMQGPGVDRTTRQGEGTDSTGTRQSDYLLAQQQLFLGDALGGLSEDELGALNRLGVSRGLLDFTGGGQLPNFMGPAPSGDSCSYRNHISPPPNNGYENGSPNGDYGTDPYRQ